MRLLALAGAGAIALAGLAGSAAAQDADGAAIYKRCAACHLATGAGVPGAFPPLRSDIRGFAMKPDGRRYLVLVVLKGVSGPIMAEGKPYRGVMPAQAGLNDAQIAAVLNHVLATSAKGAPAARPFSAAEVAQVRAGSAGVNAAAVGKLNGSLAGK